MLRNWCLIFISLICVSPVFSGTPDSTDWVSIPSGNYTPFFTDSAKSIYIEGFYIKKTAVTNSEFLKFVRAKPKWQKSKVKSIFAEDNYLEHWKSDTELGDNVNPDAPVVNVSWFAANAYCDWIGGRLPDIQEWEYAASASSTEPNAYNDAEFKNKILRMYESLPSLPLPNVGKTFRNYWGVYDMHGLVWEWTRDFNSVMISGESRKDNSIDRNIFCAAGSLGSVDPANYAAFVRYSIWGSVKAKFCMKNMGFRCIKEK